MRALTFAVFRRRLLIALAVLALLAAGDFVWLALNWPDFAATAKGAVPRSAFIEAYVERRRNDPALPPLRWSPVPLARISPEARSAVLLAEDVRFRSHGGLDLEALQEAMRRNLERREARFGASTISQQTAKNLLLHPRRTPLRKWHELVFTLAMERAWSKDRILEVYLNIAEFGVGIYGVEAAARHYWGNSAAELGRRQAIELAATLPSPDDANPRTRSQEFLRRVERIERHVERWGNLVR